MRAKISAIYSRLIQGEISASLIRTSLARGVVVIGTILLMVVLGRLYGVKGVGVYGLGQAIILTIAQISKYGMDAALMRFVSINRSSPHIMLYLKWAIIRALGISIILMIALQLGRNSLAEIFGNNELSEMLPGMTVAIPPFTIAYILSGFFKGIRKPASASLLENGSVAWVASTAIVSFYYLGNLKSLEVVGWAYALASWIVTLQGIFQVVSWKKKQYWNTQDVSRSIFTKKEFMSSSHSFFIMRIARIIQTTVSIVVAGYLLSSYELGLFKASQQMGGLISFILIVINAIYPPYFATLHSEGKYQRLQQLARQSSVIGITLIAPLLVICILYPNWILGLFGKGFPEAAVLLQIVVVAQLINVATGSVGFLLNMTGHEKLMRNISIISNIIGITSFFILIPIFRELGAAFSLAIVLILQNVIALYFVWKRLGIWTIPIPNLLQIIGINSNQK